MKENTTNRRPRTRRSPPYGSAAQPAAQASPDVNSSPEAAPTSDVTPARSDAAEGLSASAAEAPPSSGPARRRPRRKAGSLDRSMLPAEPVGQPNLDYRTLPPEDPGLRQFLADAQALVTADGRRQKIALPHVPEYVLYALEVLAQAVRDGAKATVAAVAIERGVRRLWKLKAVGTIAAARATCVRRGNPVQMTWFNNFPALAIDTAGAGVVNVWQTHISVEIVRGAAHLASVLGMPQGRAMLYALLAGLVPVSGDLPPDRQRAIRHSVTRLRDELEARAVVAQRYADTPSGATADDLDRALW